MDGLELLGNVTLKDIANNTNLILPHNGHRSHLGRFLFSHDSVNKVYTPILFLFGAVGNCLSVTVFCKAPSHRHLSSSYYLSALAISDTGFLINLLAVWLEDLGFRVITAEFTCPLVMYLGQVTCFLSVWLTVSFTVERFFAVCYPLTRPTVCTVARAKKVITGLTLLALIAFSYVWYIARALDLPIPSTPIDNPGPDEEEFSGVTGITGGNERNIDPFSLVNSSSSGNTRSGSGFGCKSSPEIHSETAEEIETYTSSHLFPCNGSEAARNLSFGEMNKDGGGTYRACYVRTEHIYFSSYASHVDSVLTLVLPFIIITYLNVRIALCVWKLKDQRQNIMAVAKISGNQNQSQIHIQNPNQNQNHSQSQIQNPYQNQQLKTDHLSSACRLPTSRSSPLLNGLPSQSSSSLSNCKSYRINVGSTTSLNVNVVQAGAGNGVNPNRTNRNHSSSTSASEARVTKTLLLVSTVFLVLNLPAHAIRAIAYIQSLWNLEMAEELQAAQHWANILFNTNFSVNFLLYCVSGRNFRKSLWNIFFSSKSGRPTKHVKRSERKQNKPTMLYNIHHKANKTGIVASTSSPGQERDLCMNSTIDLGRNIDEMHC